MKVNLSGDAIQKWFVLHVEKIVFGVCVVLFAGFIMLGFGTRGYDKYPKDVRQAAVDTKRNIEQTDPWDRIKDSPERVTLTRYSELVNEGNIPTEGGLYSYTQPLNPFVPRPLVKRQDPKLYPPVHVIVYGINASIALRNDKELPDRLEELKSVKVQAPRPKRERDDRRSGRGMMSMPPGYGGEIPGMGDDGSDAAGGIPFGDGPAPPTFGGMESPGTSSPALAGTPKVFRNPDGWRPAGLAGAMSGSGYMSGMPAMPGMPGGTGPSAGSKSAASTLYIKPSRIMVVLALIEYERQLDEYKAKLQDAVGYDPRRDLPNYLAIAVERAEVPDDPNAPLSWQQIGSTATAFNDAKQWAGVYEEVAAPQYVLPNTTLPIPPILLRDIDPIVCHPEIPRRTQQVVEQPTTPLPPGVGQPPAGGEPEGDIPSDIPRGMPGGVVPGMPPGYPFSSTPPGGLPASGLPGVGGMGGPGIAGGTGFPSAPPGMSPYGGGAEGMESDAAGGMMPGMSGMPGMAGMPPGMYPSGMPGAQSLTTKYKLVRFFDFTAEPGKTYRYRVQLLLEDPNHPENPLWDVPPRYLADDVAQRVSQVQAKEPKQGRRRYYFLRTDWSEPSAPVSTEPDERIFVGPVRGSPSLAMHKNGAKLVRDPLVTTCAAVSWDSNWGVDVPMKMDLTAGAVANAPQQQVEVVHPITLEFKQLEKYDFVTNHMLIDARGGEKVGGDAMSPLFSPAEAIVLDARGNLVVKNEIDDMDGYRRYTFADEPSADSAAGATGAMMPPGVPGGMEPGGMAPGRFPPSGPPGMEGQRGRGRASRPPRNQGS